MRVLGIDPGWRNCGVAVIGCNQAELEAYGSLHRRQYESDATFLRAVHDLIMLWAERFGVSRVAVEDQRKVCVGAMRTGQFGAGNLNVLLVQGVAYCTGREVVELQPGLVKRRIAGSHRATKEQMIAAVRMRLRLPSDAHLTEHEADAAAIALASVDPIERSRRT